MKAATRVQFSGIKILLLFDHIVSTESKNVTSCTYQNQGHFCGHLKTQEQIWVVLFHRVSSLNFIEHNRLLAQYKVSFSLTRSNKTSWCDRFTRLFEIRSARRRSASGDTKTKKNKKIIDLLTALWKLNCFLSTTNAKQGTSKAEGSPFFVKKNLFNVSPPNFICCRGAE